ncbi:MAG: hypothetical protein AB1782_16785 [Cyanobacteriota bacterium]
MVRTINNYLKNLYLNYFVKCKHKKITSSNKLSFCPDCGERIELKWFVAECSTCKTQRETCLFFGKPFSLKNKCPVCNSQSYKIIKVNTLNAFKSTNFALLKNEIKTFETFIAANPVSLSAKSKYFKPVKNNLSFQGLYKINTNLIK